jgi:hypothetical protein
LHVIFLSEHALVAHISDSNSWLGSAFHRQDDSGNKNTDPISFISLKNRIIDRHMMKMNNSLDDWIPPAAQISQIANEDGAPRRQDGGVSVKIFSEPRYIQLQNFLRILLCNCQACVSSRQFNTMPLDFPFIRAQRKHPDVHVPSSS